MAFGSTQIFARVLPCCPVIPKLSVNMADVARRSGVSIASVSRALRGQPGVSAATRDRVLASARELSYVVSPEASRLSGGATGRIGVVVPQVDSWFYSAVIAGIAGEFDAAGMDVVLCALPDVATRHRFFDTLPLRRKVDAIVVASIPLTAHERGRLDQLGVPAVFIGGDDDGRSPWVGIDDTLAAEQAVGHLVRIGHRDIAMIQALAPGGEAWATDEARIRGFHRQIADAQLPEPTVVTVQWGVDGGARGMEELLSGPRLPTAVFCHSDEIAIGALRTLRRAGVSVPQQVSVIGVDNHPSAEVADLTTVAQPARQQGEIAARLLIARPSTGPRITMLPTRLVVRGSTAPPR